MSKLAVIRQKGILVIELLVTVLTLMLINSFVIIPAAAAVKALFSGN